MTTIRSTRATETADRYARLPDRFLVCSSPRVISIFAFAIVTPPFACVGKILGSPTTLGCDSGHHLRSLQEAHWTLKIDIGIKCLHPTSIFNVGSPAGLQLCCPCVNIVFRPWCRVCEKDFASSSSAQFWPLAAFRCCRRGLAATHRRQLIAPFVI